ncbi:sensor histidine kinase [Paenibacillus sp. MMS20-IR301]|uniref:sensor histidine kinase n=1 Tax=Paenibacillus sp. MMS20-IR301 TaxID=2895946 RepID=UPI0028ED73EF|nr:sensor histidine kinase [Paenibacillus sp. MMS20-IR301]WNS43161.1 sensor histidine kinase [Paenibacillus sp. MMS20-IR301]
MRLIRRIAELLQLKQGMILVYILNTVVLILASYMFHGVKDILYPLGVSLFLLTVYLGISAIRLHKFKLKLSEAAASPQLPVDAADAADRLVFGMVNEIHEEYNSRIYQLGSSAKERNTLFSQWIHNMKVSAAVIDLAAERGTEQALADIREENGKLTANLEECLNLLRLEQFSRDYRPERVSLHRVVVKAVNARKRDFIYAGVYPKITVDEEADIYTDEKWCGSMLEQVLTNAIKYSHKGGTVTLSSSEVTEGRVLLTVADEGIGIELEDLPRAFEPFFTGRNGRDHRSATGIGLYMVKHTADRLGHSVRLDSQRGAGTVVTFTFAAV